MYYERLKEAVDEKLIDAVNEAKRILALLRKRQEDAADHLNSLIEQKKRLEEKQLASLSGADTSEVGSKKSYEGYRRTLRNHNIEIADEKEAIESLRDISIPAAEKRVYEAEAALKLSLRALCIKQANEAVVDMNEVIERYVAINDEQHAAVTRLYSDYGFIVTATYDTGVFAETTSERIACIKVIPKMIFFSQDANIKPPPKVSAPTVEPTKVEKLIVPIDDAEQLEKQVSEWKDNAFGPIPESTPIESIENVNPDTGDEAKTKGYRGLPSGDQSESNASVEVVTDTTEETESTKGV